MGRVKKLKKSVSSVAKPLLKLDLACGANKREGFIGVDRVKIDGIVDIVHDLTKYPWPFDNVSVEEVHCSHYVEHIPLAEFDGKDLFCCFIDELYRILIPTGKATIIAPWWNSVRSWQDPTHRRPISDATFLYFNKGWRVANKLEHYPIVSDFDFAPAYILDGVIVQRSEETRTFWMKHYANVINDIQVVLTKRE